jgi:uncharacterized protein (DUF885 family)
LAFRSASMRAARRIVVGGFHVQRWRKQEAINRTEGNYYHTNTRLFDR